MCLNFYTSDVKRILFIGRSREKGEQFFGKQKLYR